MVDSTTSSTSLTHPATNSTDQQLVVAAVEDQGNREGDSATTTPLQVAAEDHGTERSALLVPDVSITINSPVEAGDNDNQLSTVEKVDDAVEISELRKTFKSHMIVAALIATVTFAAAFTLPGGYVQSGGTSSSGDHQDEGMAVLSLPPNSTHHIDDPMMMRNRFLVFVWADSAALVFSLSAVLIYFLAAFPIKRAKPLRAALLCGYFLIMVAVVAMVIAFIMGLQAVLPGFFALSIFIIIIFFLSCVVPTLVVFTF